jgi:HAD superfamily hydrolase (TIGR01509 family)
MFKKYIMIPLGGIGSRFKEKNYKEPKALIEVNGKPIIYWLIDNLKIINSTTIIIPYNFNEYKDMCFENKLKKKYPDIDFKFYPIYNNTRGAVETIKIGIDYLINDLIYYPVINTVKALELNNYPILCIDSDNFYLNDIINEWNGENKIFVFNDKKEDPIYSYVKCDSSGKILKIIEKEKISDLACCGAYGFSSIKVLYEYTNKLIDNKIYQKNEFYTSGIIQLMIDNKISFKANIINNKDYFTLGTPGNLEKFKTIFLLDLDGTLVSTDNIYIDVWKELLIEFNLKTNNNFFDYFIKGKSDKQVLKYILPNITNEKINEISLKKDKLFLKKINNDILFDGVIDFFEIIKNSMIAIVTSSNRKAAQSILNNTKISEYVNLLVAAEDCKKHKPHSEPYNNAIKKLNFNYENIIILEDSISGYLSAKQITPHLYIKSSDLNNDDIFRTNKFKNFSNLKNIYNIKKISNNENNTIFSDIAKIFPIKEILKSSINLKTGYICNIDLYDIIYKDNTKKSVVLKLNNDGNILSETAKKLEMYKKEIKFYKDIAPLININVPKCYHIIDNNRFKGVLLENLFEYKGTFDSDLNNDINKCFIVIKNICDLHLKFIFNNQSDIILSMSDLKKVNQIKHYYDLVNYRYQKFKDNVKFLLSTSSLSIFNKIYENFEKIGNKLSTFPLNFCHGDYKSPNIFYKCDNSIIILDWQYIHLGKGVSDLVFLMVESINFNEKLCNTLKNLYYLLYFEGNKNYTYEQYDYDFKLSLCMFPFFVCVWFNSEDLEKLIDSTFPLRFLRNLENYYKYYLINFEI